MPKHAVVNRQTATLPVALAICAILVAITWVVFGQTLGHQFVTYDDPQYVYANREVAAGLSLEGIAWAFTHTISDNWHPLTTISHMLDCQLWRLNATGHHFMNVLLHTISVILLFLVLREMTDSVWRSGFVAALFAIHPLHVESVAWISERKDVLSAVFFMLTLGAYVRYARARSVTAYLIVLLLFAAGLMSKPMLVTVPFVLLLLDYWPLGRCSHTPVARPAVNAPHRRGYSAWLELVMEKIPLFAMSGLSSLVTLLTQFRRAGTTSQLPFTWRLSNACVSYVDYIWQMFWPGRLAAFYPHPNGQVPVWQLLCTIALLAAVTLVAIHWRKEHQYIFTGWFWYVGMLVPVIGLVQAGEQARADRYTYLPQIGLYILITWGVTDVIADVVTRKSGLRSVTNLKSMTSRSRVVRTNGPSAFDRRGELGRGKQRRSYRVPCAAMGTAIIMLLSWCAFVQTSYWNNSDALWNHALAVTGENDVAHQNLAFLFLQRRDSDSAIAHFATALKIRSHYGASHYNFGSALIENSLASVLLQKGRQSEAIEHYQKAMTLRPDYGDPYLNIGNVLLQQGRSDEAMAQWEKAITMEPRDAGFHTALGDAFLRLGMQQGAIAEYEQAVRVSAQDAVVRNNLAWLLATSSDTSIRNPNRAVELAQQAVRFSHGKNPNCVRTLAAAYAASGRFPEAQENARRALESAQRKGDSTLVTALRDEIALYELGLPYHR